MKADSGTIASVLIEIGKSCQTYRRMEQSPGVSRAARIGRLIKACRWLRLNSHWIPRRFICFPRVFIRMEMLRFRRILKWGIMGRSRWMFRRFGGMGMFQRGCRFVSLKGDQGSEVSVSSCVFIGASGPFHTSHLQSSEHIRHPSIVPTPGLFSLPSHCSYSYSRRDNTSPSSCIRDRSSQFHPSHKRTRP